jgi:hypothetical protein
VFRHLPYKIATKIAIPDESVPPLWKDVEERGMYHTNPENSEYQGALSHIIIAIRQWGVANE